MRGEPDFRLLIDATPNAVVVVDDKGLITLVNRRTEELLGYSRDELVGQSVDILTPESVRAAHSASVKAFFADPKARAMAPGRELDARRKDGAHVPVEIVLNPFKTQEGDFTLAFITDVSERRQAADMFREALEAIPSAVVVVTPAGRIVFANRRTEELFGHSPQDLFGAPIEQLTPERFHGKHEAYVKQFLEAPVSRLMGAGRDLFAVRKDGVEFPVEIGLNPFPTRHGMFALASIVDISERKRAEETHSRLAAIVESSDDAIVSNTLGGIITTWNQAAERLYGYTAQEAIGQPMAIVTPRRLAPVESELLARIARGESIEHSETIRRRKDGSEVEVSIALSPLKGASGEIVGASSITRDITEFKRRGSELQLSNAQLEQFAYVASHDLQEPLRMVANYTELLAQRYEGRLDETADRYIRYATDGARRMQRLVTDLLAYSRVGSQGGPLGPVSSGAVFDRVVSALEPQIGETQAAVEYGALPVVFADEAQLGQLLENLISNAIKFRAEVAPKITVEAVEQDGRWLFSIADNGIGMEIQHTQRIFQMFQRLHARGAYEGSGVGLAIAKQIVERHGGRIWVESEPGQGSTFFFTLGAVPGADQ